MLAECPGSLSVRGSRASALGELPGGALGARPTRRAPGRGSRGSARLDTWLAREHPGRSPGSGTRAQVSRSRASGRFLSVGVLGTRVALAGFRGSVTRWASRCTRGQVARSEGVSERGSKWPVPKEASGLAFGTGVILRRLPKEASSELRKGHPAGLRDGSEGG